MNNRFFIAFWMLLFFSLISCKKDKVASTKLPAAKLIAQKVSKTFREDMMLFSSEILEGVSGKKDGYTIKSISTINPLDAATVLGKAPYIFFKINKAGFFTATVVLQHPTKKDVYFKKMSFEIKEVITPPTPERTVEQTSRKEYIYIVVGSFKSRQKANKRLRLAKIMGFESKILPLFSNTFHRVVVPTPIDSSLLKTLKNIKNTLSKDAWLLPKEGIKKIKPTKLPAEKLTFTKLTKLFSKGGHFTTAEILDGISGKKEGYQIKNVIDIKPADVVTVNGVAPYISLTMNTVGIFTATLVLQHPNKKEVSLTKIPFEIKEVPPKKVAKKVVELPAEKLTFTKVSKAFTTDGAFTTAEILAGISGKKEGYTLKSITTINPADVATLKGIAPNFSLQTKRIGVFTATLVLQHPEKKDAIVKKCLFQLGVFDNTFGGNSVDKARGVIEAADGGYVVAGCTASKGAGSYDMWVLKLNNAGEKVWDKTFGGNEFDEAYAITNTPDGGYIVAGYTASKGAGGSDMWVLKLNNNGEKVWDKTFGGKDRDEARYIVPTADGGYAVAGYTYSKGAGSYDMWLVKIDADGIMQWDKTFGGVGGDGISSMVVMPDGGYGIVGRTQKKEGRNYNMWVLKLDAMGNKIWDKTFGKSSSYEVAQSVVASNGGYVITGYTNSKGAGKTDVWILKLDSKGKIIFDKTFGGRQNDKPFSIFPAKDGGYVIAGYTNSKGAGKADAWIFKLDATGQKIWDKTFGGSAIDEIYAVIETADGGYVLAGYTNSKGAGSYDVWVLKIDKDGNL